MLRKWLVLCIYKMSNNTKKPNGWELHILLLRVAIAITYLKIWFSRFCNVNKSVYHGHNGPVFFVLPAASDKWEKNKWHTIGLIVIV